MPTISRFYGLVIVMYLNNHEPSHFHAMHGKQKATVRIDTLDPVASTLSARDLRLVLAWAELHQQELLDNWTRIRSNQTPNAIEPLR